MLRETGMAEVNGARIYYEVAGEGDPLVLVHAGIADSRMWEDQLMAFADRYRVIRYDMRGFGMTAMVDLPFSHHEDLRGLLDSLDVERAHLVGCSMGEEQCSTSRSSTRRGSATSSWLDLPWAGSGLTSTPQGSGTRSSPPKRPGTWSGSPSWRSRSGLTAPGDPPRT